MFDVFSNDAIARRINLQNYDSTMLKYLPILLIALGFAACTTDTASDAPDLDAMQKTESGYAYELLTDEPGDTVEPGYLSIFSLRQFFDDSLVYSSAQRERDERFVMPVAARLGQRPSPVIEVLSLMSMGDSARIYVPVDSLGPNIQPWQREREFLIYEVALKDMKNLKESETAAASTTADLRAAYLDGSLQDVQTGEDGLKYKIIENGTGAKAAAGDVVRVDYYGITAEEGNTFDNSFGRGEPYRFPLGAGRVIKGWDRGIEGMNEGTKAVLFIPSALAYGSAGSPPKIGPDAELIFYVEVVEVDKK